MFEKRSYSGLLWLAIGLTSFSAMLLLLYGFGYAAFTLLHPSAAIRHYSAAAPAAPEPQPVYALAAVNELKITAVGDSLTKGTGDPSGEGYVKQVVKRLHDKTDKPVKLINNLGIAGERTGELAARLKTSGYRHAIQQADIVLLTMGGNDLFAAARTGAKGKTDLAAMQKQLKKQLPEGLKQLEAVLTSIHEMNPKAQIVYIGLYNPFYDLDSMRKGSLQVAEWNAGAYEIIQRYEHMQMIPIFDLFEERIGSYLSSDHFHPNHEGYGRIAERVVESINIEGA